MSHPPFRFLSTLEAVETGQYFYCPHFKWNCLAWAYDNQWQGLWYRGQRPQLLAHAAPWATEPHCLFYPTGGLAQDTDERNQSSQCWQRPPLAFCLQANLEPCCRARAPWWCWGCGGWGLSTPFGKADVQALVSLYLALSFSWSGCSPERRMHCPSGAPQVKTKEKKSRLCHTHAHSRSLFPC